VRVMGVPWLDTARGINLPPHQRRAGLVFQNYALFPHLDALENITTAMGHLPQAQRAERARALLTRVHLDGLEARKPAALSGGQQQRVAVARALAREPDVLLLDEPFSAVDRMTREHLYAELQALRRDLSIPTLFVTHDFDEAARLAQRICLLNHGTILQTGTPQDVLNKPVSRLAARLLNHQNVFKAKVISQDAQSIWLDWNGRRLKAAISPSFMPGIKVSWVCPASRIRLLAQDEAGIPNQFTGTIIEITRLSLGFSLHVMLDGADSPTILVTCTERDIRGTGAELGTRIPLAFEENGLHIMAGDE
jgi:molybdate transport system ATP-binding protein